MASAAGHYHCVFDGCMSVDAEIRRRPYHRNCSCALHRDGGLPQDLPCNGSPRLSFTARRSWTAASLRSTSVGVAAGPVLKEEVEEEDIWWSSSSSSA